MHVLVFEPSHSGHRLQFVNAIAKGLGDLDVATTVVVGNEAIGSRESEFHLSDLPTNCSVKYDVASPKRTGILRSWVSIANNLVNVVERYQPDHLYVPYGDGISQVLAAGLVNSKSISQINSEAIILRGGFAYPTTGLQQRLVNVAKKKLLLHSPWSVLHFLDPIPWQTLSSHRDFGNRFRLAPEPVEEIACITKAEARRVLGVDHSGRYMIAIGAQDRRKGSDLLLRAFARASLDSSCRLILAGKTDSCVQNVLVDEEMRSLVETGRVILIDEYLNQAKFEAAFSAADIIAVPYPRHVGSSGILTRAAKARVPVLASDWGYVGWATRTFSLGRCCDVANDDAFSHAIRASFNCSLDANGDNSSFVRFHSVQNFAAHLTHYLRLMMLPSCRDVRIAWQGVGGN